MNRASGFTLIEVMVVIAVTSITAVLILQMMTILFRGYDQIGRVQSELAKEAMSYGWFRDSIGSLVASLDREFAFSGDVREMEGYTSAPLFGSAGKVTEIRWQLREEADGTSLWYTEKGEPQIQVAVWQESEVGFLYRGLKSGWRNTWPPEELPAGILPHRVKLKIENQSESREIYAAISVRRTGRYDYRDFF